MVTISAQPGQPRLTTQCISQRDGFLGEFEQHPLGTAIAGAQFTSRLGRDHPPGSQDRDLVADPFDIAKDVGGEEDCGGPPQPRQQGQHIVTSHRIQRRGRLVQDQQPRRVDQGLDDTEPLLHPTGVPANRCADAGQAREFEQHPHPAISGPGVQLEERGAEAQVLRCGHPRVETGDIRYETDLRVHLVGVGQRVQAQHRCAAGVRAGQSEQDADGCGLA